MSWVFSIDGTANTSVNLAPATGAVAVWDIILALKQAGWTQQDSSDGTTHATNQVTGGGSGTNGLANSKAWVRVQDPAGVHEFVIQRGTSNNTDWRVKWSDSAKFTGGSPSATQVPAATDEQIVNAVGGGTDASPTFTTIFGADNGYRLHVGADSAAPYDWWWVALDKTTGANPRRGWLLTMVSGSYPSTDVAPYVVDFGGAGTSAFSSSANKGTGYYKKGLSGETWVTFFVLVYYSVRVNLQILPCANGSTTQALSDGNPYDAGADMLPMPLARDIGATQPGWKGFASIDTFALGGMKTCPQGQVWTNGAGTKAMIAITGGGNCIRWPVGVSQTI